MAPNKRPAKKKKYFTAAQANASLPLVRAIVSDIVHRAAELRERHERLRGVGPSDQTSLDKAHREEVSQIQADLERDQEAISEYFAELSRLGIELKDPFTGLVDFPCWMNDHEVYLCWRHGEPEVAHWHELDAGFAGRQKLQVSGVRNQESARESQEPGPHSPVSNN
jgi:hypothetical protein